MGRQITRNFNESELACPHCGKMLFTDRAVQHLQELRNSFGKPIHVNSGYRCPEHNASVSHTGPNGPHTLTADDNVTVDVGVGGGEAQRLLLCALLLGWTGTGLKQKGPFAGRFVHLDRADGGLRPWVWTY